MDTADVSPLDQNLGMSLHDLIYCYCTSIYTPFLFIIETKNALGFPFKENLTASNDQKHPSQEFKSASSSSLPVVPSNIDTGLLV